VPRARSQSRFQNMLPLPIDPPLQVVLVSPRIPPNTGNVARTCAVTGSRLHLVGPIGFSLSEKSVRRAGLDYWDDVRPDIYADWPDFESRTLRGRAEKLHLYTGRAQKSAFDIQHAPGDFLVFGSEDLGLPPALLAAYPDRCSTLPMIPGMRSLNLAVAVGIAVYEALRSISR
jgi:tRNA (cytidine/uridine-2'-O-)-methyltransferase